MYYTIYKITNTINGKIYIGKHQTKDPNDTYFGSGKAIKSAISKHGKANFIKEVLFVFDNPIDMNLMEKQLIDENFVAREDTYNLGVGGEGGPHFRGKKHGSYMRDINTSQEHREKASAGLKRYYEEHSNHRKGKSISDEHRQKIREARKGKKHSAETIAKIKEARKKQVFSDETRRKMSESAKQRENNFSGPVD